MNFEVLKNPQGSPEWKMDRCGLLTGSVIVDAMKKNSKGQFYASRADLAWNIICERLSGNPSDDVFVTKDMLRGTEQEPYARMAYEAVTGNIVRETGFLRSTVLPVGASLDGDIDDFTGIVEFKNPKTTTHMRTLELGEIPDGNIHQVMCNLWISGAQWCDFVSYDSRLPENLQYFCKRIYAKDLDLRQFEIDVRQFLAEVDAQFDKWQNYKGVTIQ